MSRPKFEEFVEGMVADYGEFVDANIVMLADGREINLMTFERGYGVHFMNPKDTVASAVGLSREAVAALGYLISVLPPDRLSVDLELLGERIASADLMRERFPDGKIVFPYDREMVVMPFEHADATEERRPAGLAAGEFTVPDNFDEPMALVNDPNSTTDEGETKEQ